MKQRKFEKHIHLDHLGLCKSVMNTNIVIIAQAHLCASIRWEMIANDVKAIKTT